MEWSRLVSLGRVEDMEKKRVEAQGNSQIDWTKMDTLTTQFMKSHRSLAEANQSYSTLEELITIMDREEVELRAQLHHLKVSTQPYTARGPQHCTTEASLQSSVELIRVQIGDEQQEKLVMENELESLNKRLEEVQQSYLDKLDKIKAQYGDRLMDATNLERKKKLSELKFRIRNMEMDQRTQALKEWMSFKEVVVMLAEQQVKYRAEHKKKEQLNTAIQTYNKTIKHVEADCTQKRQSKRGENVLCWSLPSITIQDQMISGTSKFSQPSVQQNFTSSKILDNQWQTAQHCPAAIMAVTRGQDLQQSHTSVTANIQGQEKAQQLTSVKPDSHSQDTQQLLAPLTADRERQDTDIIEDYQRNDIQQCPIPVTKDFQRLHKKQCSSPTLTHDQKVDTVLGFTPKTRNDQREVIEQSLTSDIQGQQMRGTLQPRQMFSSSLSRLKLKLPKFGEKKKMSQSLTETSNKEGSWILSNVIESSSFHHPNVSETRPSNLTSSLFSYTSSSSDKPPNLTTMSNFNSHKSTDHGCLSISTPGGRQTESISGNISQKYHIKVDVAGVGERCSKELISLTSESENKLPISSCTPHSTLQPKDSVSETHHRDEMKRKGINTLKPGPLQTTRLHVERACRPNVSTLVPSLSTRYQQLSYKTLTPGRQRASSPGDNTKIPNQSLPTGVPAGGVSCDNQNQPFNSNVVTDVGSSEEIAGSMRHDGVKAAVNVGEANTTTTSDALTASQTIETEETDSSEMDYSLSSSQGFSFTENPGSVETQTSCTSEMMDVSTDSYPKLAAELYTSSLIVEPPASRNASSTFSPSQNLCVTSSHATAGTSGSLYLSVQSPSCSVTEKGPNIVPPSSQDNLLARKSMLFSSPIYSTSPTEPSNISHTKKIQKLRCSPESVLALSPIYHTDGSVENFQESTTGTPNPKSYAFMFGGSPDNGRMAAAPLSLFGTPETQTSAQVDNQKKSGVTFSLFGDVTSPKQDSESFFNFNFGSDGDNGQDSGSSGFLSSLFGSPPPDTDSQQGAGFKLF